MEAEEEFIFGSFRILSPDVIIEKIMFEMSSNSILSLCGSSPEFQEFCNRHSERIWRMLLIRDYPCFGVVGDPKQHYMKIFNGEGEEFYFKFVIPRDIDDNDVILRSFKSTSEGTGNVTILGNPQPRNTRIFII